MPSRTQAGGAGTKVARLAQSVQPLQGASRRCRAPWASRQVRLHRTGQHLSVYCLFVCLSLYVMCVFVYCLFSPHRPTIWTEAPEIRLMRWRTASLRVSKLGAILVHHDLHHHHHHHHHHDLPPPPPSPPPRRRRRCCCRLRHGLSRVAVPRRGNARGRPGLLISTMRSPCRTLELDRPNEGGCVGGTVMVSCNAVMQFVI